MDEIIKLVESRNQIALQAFEVYQPLVNSIIASENKDVNYISLTLDYMLGFCFDDQMLLLYRRLCRYMLDFAPQATADYIQAYRETWDEEGVMFGNNKNGVE